MTVLAVVINVAGMLVYGVALATAWTDHPRGRNVAVWAWAIVLGGLARTQVIHNLSAVSFVMFGLGWLSPPIGYLLAARDRRQLHAIAGQALARNDTGTGSQ